MSTIKVCIVSSRGGHLTEIRALLPVNGGRPHFHVLNSQALLPAVMQGKTCFIAHSERDLKYFVNLWEAFAILHRERPQVILSAGAGPAVPFALVGHLLIRCRIVFNETITCVHRPSVTGRLMYWLAHDFFYQWRTLGWYFPRGRYGGALL